MTRLFEWIVDHPYLSIGIVLLVTIGFALFIPQLRSETDFREFISKDDPVIKAWDRAEERYGRQFGITIMVINEEGIFNTETLTKIKRMEEELKRIRGVKEVTSPLSAQVITGTEQALNVGPAAPDGEVPKTSEEMTAFRKRVLGSRMLRDNIVSSDGRAGAISIELRVGADEPEITREVVRIVDSYNSPPDEIHIIGDAYMDKIINDQMGRDFGILLPLAIGMIVFVLFLSFRNLRGVLMPLSVVLLSVLITMGAMSLLGFPITMVSFILPILLIAIGIADGIHVMNRYHEEAPKGISKREAILNTMEEMKGPVIMTSLTTGAGFFSLISSFFIPQKHFGIAAALGVLVAMVISLVLIPAVMAILKKPKRRVYAKESSILTKALLGFRWLIVRHRRGVLLGSVFLLVAMLAGLPLISLESSNEEMLGEDHPVIQIIDLMDKHFSGTAEVMVEIDTGTRDGLKNPVLLSKMVELEEFLKSRGIRKTFSLADLVREMNQKFHADDPAYYVVPDDRKLVSQLLLLFTFQGGRLGNMALGDFSAGTVVGLYEMSGTEEMRRLRNEVEGYLKANFAGLATTEMVGTTAIYARLMTRLTNSQLISLATSMGAIGLIVALLMGSVVAGLVGLIPLGMTVAVNFGIMAYSGTPLDVATLMVSAIGIGIGVDYAIHFISRFRREYRADRDAERALEVTLRTTGRAITYNALTVALGFVILAVASFKGVRSFGLLVAMTMVVGALSALTIIPAILVTWKPKFLVRKAWSRREATARIREPQLGGAQLNPNPSLKEVKDARCES